VAAAVRTADLTLLDRSFETFLATKFCSHGRDRLHPILVAYFAILGLHVVVGVPVWLGIFFALIFFLLPTCSCGRGGVAPA